MIAIVKRLDSFLPNCPKHIIGLLRKWELNDIHKGWAYVLASQGLQNAMEIYELGPQLGRDFYFRFLDGG